MLHINSEVMYIILVFRKSVYTDLKQTSLFWKEANVVSAASSAVPSVTEW